MSNKTIVDVFWQRVANNPEQRAILHKVDGAYRPVIWREQGRTVELTAAGLMALGILKDEKVAIMSQTRAQWTWADLAGLSCACATVPIYATLTGGEAKYIIEQSDSVAIFLEDQLQLDKLQALPELPAKLRLAILFQGEVTSADKRLKVITWQELLKEGEAYLIKNGEAVKERIKAISPEDIATIVYTSGTTGVPKGAVLLHKTIYSVCESIEETAEFHVDDLSLSFLPLSHVYERVGGQFFSIFHGIVVAYAESMEKVPQNIQEVKPTIINGVPRFFEKAYQRIQTQIKAMPKPQQFLVRWALSLGQHASHVPKDVKESGLAKSFFRGELRVADRLVYSKIRARFGGRLRVMISGAAPLSDEVHLFFDTIGLTIVEGYGLTETSAPACCNRLNDRRVGTVGKPLPGVEIKIADDGEILIKGASVFAGYYKNKEATDATFRDGWFLTGDIGKFDADGYLHITDRKKDLIITSNGKHVAPQQIENLLRGQGLISQVLVYGDNRKFISALITLNEDAVKSYAKTHNVAYTDYADLTNHPQVLKVVDELIALHNEDLASFEKIRKFKILENDFSIESDELTPTMKIKRKVVTAKYKQILDSFYDAEDPVPDAEKVSTRR